MDTQYMNLQDAQKGRPARPQQAKRRIVLLRYGEPLSDARTPLADFFRILLGPRWPALPSAVVTPNAPASLSPPVR